MKKESRSVCLTSPAATIIYATNCIPMVVNIVFPPDFTEDDQKRAYEALRAIYEEVTDRELLKQ